MQTRVSRTDGSHSYDLVNQEPGSAITEVDALGNQNKYYIQDEKNKSLMYTRSFAKWGSYQESSLQGMRSDNPSRPSQSVTTFDATGNVVGITEDVWGNADAVSPYRQLQRSFINGKGADPNKALRTKTRCA